MQLTVAHRADFIQIAKDIYDLWSAGLSKDTHRHLLWSGYYQAWSKRNLYRMVFKDKERVAVSCKVIHLPLYWRGKHFKLLGLGAIYTAVDYRGQGLATKLVKAMVNKARQENIDCLLLFSDIDRQFYANCGFVNLGNLDCEINVGRYIGDHFEQNNIHQVDIDNFDVQNGCFSSLKTGLTDDEISEMLRCYNRWLARQPFGIMRSHNYFMFQLARQLFIASYSKRNKAKPCLSLLKNNQTIVGYAISEYGCNSLRILEVIGTDLARAQLWHHLMKQAQQMNIQHSTGFESISRDFVPVQRLEVEKLKLQPAIKPSHIHCYERFWGQPMILPLNRVLEKLPEYNPCPILEFDYF